MADYNNAVVFYDACGIEYSKQIKKTLERGFERECFLINLDAHENTLSKINSALKTSKYVIFMFSSIYSNEQLLSEAKNAFNSDKQIISLKLNDPSLKQQISVHQSEFTDNYSLSKKVSEEVEKLKKMEIRGPDFIESIISFNMGNIYFNFGKYDEAIRCYKKAVKIIPDFVDALNNFNSLSNLRLSEIEDKRPAIYKDAKIDEIVPDIFSNAVEEPEETQKCTELEPEELEDLILEGEIGAGPEPELEKEVETPVEENIETELETNIEDEMVEIEELNNEKEVIFEEEPQEDIEIESDDVDDELISDAEIEEFGIEENFEEIEEDIPETEEISDETEIILEEEIESEIDEVVVEISEEIIEDIEILEVVDESEDIEKIIDADTSGELESFEELLDKNEIEEETQELILGDITDTGFAEVLTFANALYESGDFNAAEVEYKKAIILNPNYSEAHNNYGCLLEYLERFDEAEVEFKKAIELNVLNIRAHNNLATLLAKAEKYEEAEMHYKKAIELDPEYWGAIYNLGAMYATLKRYDDAISQVKSMIKIFRSEGNIKEVLELKKLVKHLKKLKIQNGK
ncbi:tetratricopeptide repeat protein [Methanococcus maripaludis]|uniref:Tetratricopeptide (TPR) repeat protein n=2 Tax=Methanococcus maripaludis TaxID=39152 RepID=A0A7J9PFH6_METMI|nr:tetratricopeptide repeat protein [Methanococcus maripaludis]MBA2861891.1 tetratricopeptide (TPR) repeat protein [Methanococcus maripaludis]